MSGKTIVRDYTVDGEGIHWEMKPRIFLNGPSVMVVGPDGVGKTTIVRHLSQMTQVPSFKCPSEKEIFHRGGTSSLVFDHMLTHFLSQTGFRFISDRGYPCEWVYSQAFGRERDETALRLIDDAHSRLGTVIVYLYSSEQPTEEDDLVPSEKYWEVKGLYDQFTHWTHCRTISIDTAPMLRSYRLGGDSSVDFARGIISSISVLGVRF